MYIRIYIYIYIPNLLHLQSCVNKGRSSIRALGCTMSDCVSNHESPALHSLRALKMKSVCLEEFVLAERRGCRGRETKEATEALVQLAI
jgi:hypothetical protein